VVTQPPNPELASQKSASIRLDSWKEIAAYLKRDIRTVQRWEVSEGLPIHRHLHRKQGAVYAYALELDSWWHNHDAAVGSSETIVKNSAGFDEGELQSPTAIIRRHFLQSRIARTSISMRVVILILLIVLAGLTVWRLEKRSLAQSTSSLVLSGNRLVALGDDGTALWSYQYERGPKKIMLSEVLPQSFCGRGGIDALVSVETGGAINDELDCFAEGGTLSWRFQLDESYLCQGTGFGPPWRIHTWKTYRVGDEKRLAVALHHDNWWPGLIVTLDSKGRVLQRFLNAGWITDLRAIENAHGHFLVAAGMTNSHDAAMLTILDVNSVGGTSPEQPASKYDCSSSFTGYPLKYYVFPRTELNTVTGAERNFAELDDNGTSLFARTRENRSSGHFDAAEVLYGFSDTLELASATFGDRYWDIHAELQKAGVLNHSKSQCPDRFGPRLVRMWDPEHGWTDLHPH